MPVEKLRAGGVTAGEAKADVSAERAAWTDLQAETRRLLAELDTPPALAAAIRLDTWLLNEARATGSPRVPTTRVYQYGPACVRDNRALKEALATLTERGRARLEEEGRRRFVAVNPALLDG